MTWKNAHINHDEDEDKKGAKDKDMERLDRNEMVKRYHAIEKIAPLMRTRRVRIGVSSEEPVERDFGMEVIDHSRESMNLDFLNSGRAPLFA